MPSLVGWDTSHKEFNTPDQPAISVDTKERGEGADRRLRHGGAGWSPAGEPTRVHVHDFADRALGVLAKSIPYGIYDVADNVRDAVYTSAA